MIQASTILDLKQQEQQLHISLDNLRGDRKKLRDYRDYDKQLRETIRKRRNLEAAAQFDEGVLARKANSEEVGIVLETVITPGGHAEVWVTWFSIGAENINLGLLRTLLIGGATPRLCQDFIYSSFVRGTVPVVEQPELLQCLEYGDKKIVEPLNQTDNSLCNTNPSKKVPLFFQAQPPLQQDTTFQEEVVIVQAAPPPDINLSGQSSLIDTPRLLTESDSPQPELLKPTQLDLATNLSSDSKPQTCLSLEALVRICPLLGKEPDLMAIAQACFLRQSDFFDSSTLRLSYLKMSPDCSPAITETTLNKSSAPSLNWGIWGVGNLEAESNGLLKADSESFLWVLTGNVQCTAISPNRPSLQDCLESPNAAILHRSQSGDRIYTELAPTLRSCASTNGHQGGSGAWKVKEEDGSLRPLRPTESERLMGWEIGSTEFGITADGEEIRISNTQRHKMLGNGIIPAEIEDICNSLKPILEAMKQSNVIDSQLEVDNQSNYGMMGELLPALSLATDGGTEPNTSEVPAMDNHTISGTVVAAKNFSVGDRVKSNSPVFPDTICTISAIPSKEAAIVELEDGARERLLLKHLEPLNENQESSDVYGAPVAKFEIIEELSPDEERERHRLESKVERAFYEAGRALRDLRDKRLYRSTHTTFQEYCQDRFGYTHRNANYTIAAAAVVENLGTICSQNDVNKTMGTICSQILPTNESQVRPLTKLQPEEQRTCWQQAVDLADGKVPTGKIVKGVVERMKEKPLRLASDFCEVGDVFILKKLEGVEHKYNKCWAIASDTSGINVRVDFYNGTLTVKPENLDKLDSLDAQRQLPQVLARIRRLRAASDTLDRATITMLEHFGKHHYLTPIEDKILRTLEKEYGVIVDEASTT